MATAIALTLIIDALFNWAENREKFPIKFRPIISFVLTGFILAYLVLYPAFVKGFPLVKYKVGRATDLYDFFREQPDDILIASLEEEANLLPTFAQRSILLGREYAIPYQVGYYTQFRQRVIDLIVAQYSSDLIDVKSFIQKYGVDFWMVHRGSFTPEYVCLLYTSDAADD